MLCGTPPRKANADTCPSQNASVVSAGYAFHEYAVAVRQRHHEVVDPAPLIPVRFTYDTKEVKTTAIVNKTHLTYHKGIGRSQEAIDERK